MCVLLISLHLIAIFWEKNECRRNCYIFCLWDQCFMFVCFYSLWSDLCVLRLIFNKDSKGSSGSCETFWVAPSFLMPCHTDYRPPWPPNSPVFSIQILAGMLMGPSTCSCSMKTAWRQRAAESSGWHVCPASLEEPSPGTLTLPAVQGMRTDV